MYLLYVTDSVLYLCVVAVLWGVTNPFMKKGAQGLETVKATSAYKQFIKEIAFLVTNLKVCYIFVSDIFYQIIIYYKIYVYNWFYCFTQYLLPFLLNQCGSVLYFLTLQSTDISLAVPVSNSLTFVFTAMTGSFLGEEKVHKSKYI